MSARDGRLGVGIVGAGRVGPVIGAALAGAGHALVGVSASTDDERDRVESMLPGVPVLTVQQIVERSELVVIAVPDDEWGVRIVLAATSGDLAAWRERLSEALPRPALPRQLLRLPELPRTEGGKPDRAALREEAERGNVRSS